MMHQIKPVVIVLIVCIALVAMFTVKKMRDAVRINPLPLDFIIECVVGIHQTTIGIADGMSRGLDAAEKQRKK